MTTTKEQYFAGKRNTTKNSGENERDAGWFVSGLGEQNCLKLTCLPVTLGFTRMICFGL